MLTPNPERMKSWMDRLGERSARFDVSVHELAGRADREAAIICTSMLEELLFDLLKMFMIDQGGAKDRGLANGQGPLSTFSNRIDIARSFGIISEPLAAEMKRIKNIRNDFAHRFDIDSFGDVEVAEDCAKLELVTVQLAIAASGLLKPTMIEADGKRYVNGREVAWAITDSGNSVAFWVERYDEDVTQPKARFLNAAKSVFMLTAATLMNHLTPFVTAEPAQ